MGHPGWPTNLENYLKLCILTVFYLFLSGNGSNVVTDLYGKESQLPTAVRTSDYDVSTSCHAAGMEKLPIMCLSGWFT